METLNGTFYGRIKISILSMRELHVDSVESIHATTRICIK